MRTPEWQAALASALDEPARCFLCAETNWRRCHRKLISELLVARGHEVLHLLPTGIEGHRLPTTPTPATVVSTSAASLLPSP